MSKTYKHKTNGSTMTYKDGCMKIENLVIEGHPNLEYWDEIVEKEYEILSIISKSNKDVFDKKYFTNISCFETLLKNISGFDIYSVKRLSDGEIFTVGG